MLVLKCFENYKQIDEIHIKNIGCANPHVIDSKEYYLYEIRKPRGKYETIFHRKSDGWMPLAVHAINQVFRTKHRIKS